MASGGLQGWLDRHDPTRYALHRGIRAAIAVTGILPLSRVLVGNPQFTLFAAFGALALLIFVDFPGDRRTRAVSYLLLGAAGMILITFGTVASGSGPVAVLTMAVIGFIVLFSGVLSAALAASSRVLLLAFVLPVTVPVGVGEILPRLGGWGFGMAVAIPLALFLRPPREHHDLRDGVSRSCRALAAAVGDLAPGGAASTSTEVDEALGGLRRSFRASVSRPVGLSAGGRLLARVIRDLDWLWIETRGASESGRRHRIDRPQQVAPEVDEQSAVVLQTASTALDQPTKQNRDRLSAELDTLTATRTRALHGWLDETLSGRPPADLAVVERLHSMGYATELVGRHVGAALAADARSPFAEFVGHGSQTVMAGPVPGAVQAGTGLVRNHLSWQSVWLHNSLRGALGMALAVLLAEVTQVQHGFWVALGAMSVLRSSALNTGATAFRALAGTVVGVVVGAGALILLDGSPVAWLVLPLAMFLAGFANDAISFAAGQAAFSMAVLIMFSLLAPAGWEIGLVRLEDVAIGAGAGVAVGLLLWPRGAGGAIRRAMADAFRWNARLLVDAVDRVTGDQSPDALDPADVLGAAFRLDDALRQYLADRGAKSVDIEDLVAVCVSAERIRLTSEALYALAARGAAGGLIAGAAESGGTAAGADRSGRFQVLPSLAADFQHRADHQVHWMESVAKELTDDITGIAAAPPADAVAAVLSEAHRHPDDAAYLRSEPAVVWVAIHLDDLARHESRLRPRAVALGTPTDPFREAAPAAG